MKKSKICGLLLALALLPGCGSLIPKSVEFGQSKVKAFPEPTDKQVEVQREVAKRAHEKTSEAFHAAIKEDSGPDVLFPLGDAEKLTEAVSTSLGPPASRGPEDTNKLIAKLESQINKLSQKVDDFKDRNQELVGKKIEGTGFLQIPYLVYVGLIALALILGWHILKIALTAASVANPGAAVGLGVVNVAGSVASKAFSQIVKGGENFLDKIKTEIQDPALQAKIKDLFTSAHKEAQDAEVRAIVDTNTK